MLYTCSSLNPLNQVLVSYANYSSSQVKIIIFCLNPLNQVLVSYKKGKLAF